MPELPEVETVRRSIAPLLVGKTIERVWRSSLALRREPPDARLIRRALAGRRIHAVERIGKYLLLAGGEAGALVHLGMSGQLTVEREGTPLRKHTHVRLFLDGGNEVRYVDPRRFGLFRPFVGALPPGEWRALGPDPLDEAFTSLALHEALLHTRRAVKLALLDQSVVAGLGNIYVAEALFLGGIHPERAGESIAAHEAVRLHRAILDVITQGIANRGTTLSDYVDARGEKGSNQHHLFVYGRAGERCRKCRGVVRMVVLGARSTFYCEQCQPKAGRRTRRRSAAA